MILYALHDALVKPLPDQRMAPSLAESWSASPDGLVYEFVLRQGVQFHNGEPVTADDVKFSFERYRGISAQMLKERVAAIETPDARHIRFRLTQPWPRQQQALVRPPQAPPQNVSLQAVASSACTLLR